MIELNDIYENNDIKSSAYYDSLNQNIKYIENLHELLEQKSLINEEKQNKFISFVNTKRIPIFGSIILISNLLQLLFKMNVLSIMLPSITSYILFTIINLKRYKSKDKLIKTKMTALVNIYNYLATEQEITKDMKYLLSSSIIYKSEDLLQKDIKTVMKSKSPKSLNLQSINCKYKKGHKNNLIILDRLTNLDDNQKQKYLVDLYSNINNGTIYSNDNLTNIINKNFEPINDSQVLLIENKTCDDTTIKPFNQSPLESNVGVSLSKDNYSLNNHTNKDFIHSIDNGRACPSCINTIDELNDIFTYQNPDDDILPPKAQKEREKGHNLTKKLPNFPK